MIKTTKYIVPYIDYKRHMLLWVSALNPRKKFLRYIRISYIKYRLFGVTNVDINNLIRERSDLISSMKLYNKHDAHTIYMVDEITGGGRTNETKL